MNIFKHKKTILLITALGLAVFAGFKLNIAEIQDKFYGSRYFRPYAQLKQEYWGNLIIQLKDEKVLLINRKHSEIFDPKTKTSKLYPGLNSLNIDTEFPNLLRLADGNILITEGKINNLGQIGCDDPESKLYVNQKYCPKNVTPLFDVKLKKFRWVPYPLQYLQGHSATLLPDGNVVFIGGARKEPEGPNFLGVLGKPYLQNNVVLYNTKTYKIKILGHLQVPRYNHTATLVDKDRILVFGGALATGPIAFDFHPDRTLKVELFNLKTGKSQVISDGIFSGSSSPLFLLNQGEYLICHDHGLGSKIYSYIFDLKAPKKPITITGEIHQNFYDHTGECVMMPNRHVICPGGDEVREIDPVHLKSRSLDYLMTSMLSHVKPIYDSEVGLLVFGTPRFVRMDGSTRQTTVQVFDYKRYLSDLREGK